MSCICIIVYWRYVWNLIRFVDIYLCVLSLWHGCISCIIRKVISTWLIRRLGAVMVSVLATGPKVRVFKPSRGGGLLRAIKVRSTPFFRGLRKPEVPCHKILPHVTNHFEMWTKTLHGIIMNSTPVDGRIQGHNFIPIDMIIIVVWYSLTVLYEILIFHDYIVTAPLFVC
jgi:hypothetical protein